MESDALITALPPRVRIALNHHARRRTHHVHVTALTNALTTVHVIVLGSRVIGHPCASTVFRDTWRSPPGRAVAELRSAFHGFGSRAHRSPAFDGSSLGPV
ncbi:hypothetical protein GCM10009804_11350 [Kribbella hippodromi]|uniref:Uncharacterized protein n=1 Tax=Kribbella hippodromi TaxID=434347 RepID=A0ABN2CEG2_9ACTN